MDSKYSTDVAVSPSSHSDAVFEDYLFYAVLQLEEENGGQKVFSPVDTQFTSGSKTDRVKEEPRHLPPMTPDQQESAEATRALRIVSWMSVSFLLTADVVGPFTAPFAISQVGWIPGAILFIIRCVCLSVIALPLIHVPVSSGYTIVILRNSVMGTIHSTRFSPVSAQNICRYSGTDLRTICMSYMQYFASDAIIDRCMFLPSRPCPISLPI
jgi:hypothetical protein